MDKLKLEALHDLSTYNRARLKRSKLAGCYCCGAMYPADEIREWIDKDQTAMCPKCGIDSVLPDSMKDDLTLSLLQQMFDFWFGRAFEPKSAKPVPGLTRNW